MLLLLLLFHGNNTSSVGRSRRRVVAEFARDGAVTEEWSEIPDGYFTVGDASRPAPDFQKAVIAAAATATHICEPDEAGNIIGVPMAQRGVINYPGVGLCGNHTSATFVTTTEVYPDSPKCSAEQCNQAQAAVICAGIEYAVAHHDDEGAAGAPASSKPSRSRAYFVQ